MSELLDHFQRATRLATELEFCPRWRWRRRRRLEADYARACVAADRARDRLGALPAGAKPLQEIIQTTQRENPR